MLKACECDWSHRSNCFVGIRNVLPARLDLPVPGSYHRDFTTDILLGQSNLKGVALPLLVVWRRFIFIWMILQYYLSMICLLPSLLWSFQKIRKNVWKKNGTTVNRGPPRCSKTLNKRPRHWWWAKTLIVSRTLIWVDVQIQDFTPTTDLRPPSHVKTQDNGGDGNPMCHYKIVYNMYKCQMLTRLNCLQEAGTVLPRGPGPSLHHQLQRGLARGSSKGGSRAVLYQQMENSLLYL